MYYVSEMLEVDNPDDSWAYNNGISVFWQQLDNSEDIQMRYLKSFNQAFLMLIGEGMDSHTMAMLITSILIMFLGALINAAIFGQMALLMGNFSRASTDYQEKLDNVNEFMRTAHLSKGLQDRVMQYYNWLWNLNHCHDRDAFLKDMSPALVREIHLETNGDLVRNVNLFKRLRPSALVSVCEKLEHRVYLTDDIIIKEDSIAAEMYFLRDGICHIFQGEKLTGRLGAGQNFNEQGILSNGVPSHETVIAMSYCDTMTLSSSKFRLMLREFPAEIKNIRRAVNTAVGEIVHAHSVSGAGDDSGGGTSHDSNSAPKDDKGVNSEKIQTSAEKQDTGLDTKRLAVLRNAAFNMYGKMLRDDDALLDDGSKMRKEDMHELKRHIDKMISPLHNFQSLLPSGSRGAVSEEKKEENSGLHAVPEHSEDKVKNNKEAVVTKQYLDDFEERMRVHLQDIVSSTVLSASPRRPQDGPAQSPVQLQPLALTPGRGRAASPRILALRERVERLKKNR